MQKISVFLKKKKQKAEEHAITIFTEEKEKCEYYHECNKDLSEEQNQKLVEYKRNYYATQ